MKFWIEPLTDANGSKYWLLFEHGLFHAPTAVIDDENMRGISRMVLGVSPNGRHDVPDLREMRKQAGLTLKEVSEATGTSVSYLSDLERGRRYTITDKVRSVIDYLNEVKGD